MAFDPPWRLDPLKNIIGVGWGGSIAVMYFEYVLTVSGLDNAAPPTWTALFTSAAGNGDLTQEIGPVVLPPGPPPPDVLTQNNFYCYPRTRKLDTVTTTTVFHTTDVGRYGVACSDGIVSSFNDPIAGQVVPFIIDSTRNGIFNEGGFDVYGVKDHDPSVENALRQMMQSVATQTFGLGIFGTTQYLQLEISGHDTVEVVTRHTLSGKTVTFLNIGKIGQIPSVRENESFEIIANMQPLDRGTLTWKWSMRTFLGGAKIFTPEGEPDGGQNEADFEQITPIYQDEKPAQPIEAKFVIDLLTYQITASKRNL